MFLSGIPKPLTQQLRLKMSPSSPVILIPCIKWRFCSICPFNTAHLPLSAVITLLTPDAAGWNSPLIRRFIRTPFKSRIVDQIQFICHISCFQLNTTYQKCSSCSCHSHKHGNGFFCRKLECENQSLPSVIHGFYLSHSQYSVPPMILVRSARITDTTAPCSWFSGFSDSVFT